MIVIPVRNHCQLMVVPCLGPKGYCSSANCQCCNAAWGMNATAADTDQHVLEAWSRMAVLVLSPELAHARC